MKRDYDPDADFVKYKTFDWLLKSEEEVTNAQQAFIHNPLLNKRVKILLSVMICKALLRA